MTRDASIVELADWLQTPPGRYLLAWEQLRLDAAVADRFGFHALQLGLPELDALRANRMPQRWLAQDGQEQRPAARVVLRCDFDALPFESNSLDLIVLPHALELARDPHRTLREVERVLRPEGRVVINGFNPASLWGLRQNLGRLFGARHRLFMPRTGDFIGYWRLRDWLRLLSFEVEAAQFGGYAPPLRSDKWLQRWSWIERIGQRWWPVLGAVYFVVAVKRVHGMRLIGLAKRSKRAAQAAPAVVTQVGHHTHQQQTQKHR
ncbi:class I SAM-dependent methyltransferase [Pelomonas sp. V22]|uniref:class I SAM-dependent methyltransferase n=1 Tax=Pelomonas sp. V22 TaxID=2822139 RepID=UPI0024A96DDE|nr:class I SAM-dependent methyltransferase [Pelomonas sp. V22]MDI4632269.1 class I SAM-dependent methyltransferase [Pelomonas sp. V22]